MKLMSLLAVIVIALPGFGRMQNTRDYFTQRLITAIKDNNAYDYEGLRFKTTGNIPSCRQEFYFALALISTDDPINIALANRILDKYLASQVTNHDSPYLGAWFYPELLGKTEGLEWDMFNPIPVLIIFNRFYGKTTKSNRLLFTKACGNIIKGLSAKWFPNHMLDSAIGHTNYHLMYVADLLLASEFAVDGMGQSLAMTALRNWVDFTKASGITEFNSPTYIAVDLQALNAIEQFSRNRHARELAKTMTDILLADAMIHFKRPHGMFGANSRSYDVMNGYGKTCRYLEMTISGKFDPPLEPSAILEVFWEHGLDSWMHTLFAKIGKESFEFSSKWGKGLWQTRKTWFGESLVMGTSGQAYGSQDRNLVIDRKDGRWASSFVPVIAINDSPHKLPEMGGGSGLNHLRVPVFTAQDGNKAIQLLDIRYADPELEMNRLSLAFLFPQSEMLFEDKSKALSAFAVRSGSDLIMVRPFCSSPDAKSSTAKKDGMMMVEIRLVHDLRKDLGKRFFVGFAVEIAENVYDPYEAFREWLKKPLEFMLDEYEKLVKAGFEGLKIHYSPDLHRPLNAPDHDGSVMKSPWTCLDSEGLWTPWVTIQD